jgi:hypothetical protein
MDSTTLLVLAAGIGSRYGGIKQMDPVGPCGEFVLDYSIYDAWRAGFSRAVFIVREELEGPLREHFGEVLDGRLDVTYAFQRLDDLPAGHEVPRQRVKPWGTGHAIWSARRAISGPFGVINADDFYGPGAYRALAGFLTGVGCDATTYGMVAYRLLNTLSRHGSVARGICSCDANGFLEGVVERTDVELTENGARCRLQDGCWMALTGGELTSLNLWGFSPALFAELGGLFAEFLKEKGDDPKAEFFIPTAVDSMIKSGRCRTAVLLTDERWFGMTYKSDRDLVVRRIGELIASGAYPGNLWQR